MVRKIKAKGIIGITDPRKLGVCLPEDSDPDFLGEIIEVAKPPHV